MQSRTLFEMKENYSFYDLVNIMDLLRSPQGCPWDREQTHQSIRKNLIEETYEVIEGIDNEDTGLLKEELGDLLLQVVFHSRMANEEQQFDIDDVCDGICKKLIRRHPHIFGDVVVADSGQVLDNWDKIKRDEKQQISTAETLEHIFKGMPALMRAQKVQSKAAKAGFDWENVDGAMDKLFEETAELKNAMADADKLAVADEAGDLLFSYVNVMRFAGVDSEEVLSRATDKFIGRFKNVEKMVVADGLDMSALSIERLDEYWERAKKL